MIKQVLEYCVTPLNKTPTKEDIQSAIEIAAQHDCIVKLIWYVRYSGWYERFIEATNDVNEVYAHLPHIYGL
jgi:hypothetical protein